MQTNRSHTSLQANMGTQSPGPRSGNEGAEGLNAELFLRMYVQHDIQHTSKHGYLRRRHVPFISKL